MINKKPFCYAPWMSMQYGSILYNRGATPCCEWKGDSFKGNVTEYQNSQFLKNIKRNMIENNMLYIQKTCEECINFENIGIQSRRLRLQDQYDDLPKNITHVDYRPSNTCNLKCRMCSPLSSSQIAKEMLIDVTLRDTTDFYNFDFSHVERLYVVGGEPSIDINVHVLFQKLIDQNLAKNINLEISTNATNINEKWKKLISNFNTVDAIISLDGTEKTYEYIRTNANWKIIEQNCIEYQHTCTNVMYQITASVLNVINIEDWLPWFINSNIFTTIWPVSDVVRYENWSYLKTGILKKDIIPTIGLNAIPNEIKKEKLLYLNSIDHDLSKSVISMLNESIFNMDTYQSLIEWATDLDKKRKTDFCSVSEQHKRLFYYYKK